MRVPEGDLIVCAVAGAVLGVLLGALLHGAPVGSGRAASATPASVTTAAPRSPTTSQGPVVATVRTQPPPAEPVTAAALQGALEDGAEAVTARGLGSAQLALMLDGDLAPVTGGPDVTRGGSRVWSMIKPVTAVALLRGQQLESEDTGETLSAALRRSENCPQRRLLLRLQAVSSGIDGAKRALRDVVSAAGGSLRTAGAQVSPDGHDCRTPAYEGLTEAEALNPAVLAGTATWRITDAVRFAHALRGRTTYGPDVSDRVLRFLRARKLRSREPGVDAQTVASPDWGAGAVFRASCWRVAYKGGWGRNQKLRFTAGQFGSVDLPSGRWAAFAVVFRPGQQPPDSDPAKARAPEALAAALRPLKAALRSEFESNCA